MAVAEATGGQTTPISERAYSMKINTPRSLAYNTSDDAGQLVLANMKELKPESLFSTKPFVSKDYKH